MTYTIDHLPSPEFAFPNENFPMAEAPIRDTLGLFWRTKYGDSPDDEAMNHMSAAQADMTRVNAFIHQYLHNKLTTAGQVAIYDAALLSEVVDGAYNNITGEYSDPNTTEYKAMTEAVGHFKNNFHMRNNNQMPVTPIEKKYVLGLLADRSVITKHWHERMEATTCDQDTKNIINGVTNHVPNREWRKPGQRLIDTEQLADMYDDMSVDSIGIMSVQALNYLENHASNDAETMRKVIFVESILAPACSWLGLDNLESRLLTNCKILRYKYSGRIDKLESVRTMMNSFGSAKNACDTAMSVLSKIFGGSHHEPVVDYDEKHNLLFVEGLIEWGENDACRVKGRMKAEGPVAQKSDEVRDDMRKRLANDTANSAKKGDPTDTSNGTMDDAFREQISQWLNNQKSDVSDKDATMDIFAMRIVVENEDQMRAVFLQMAKYMQAMSQDSNANFQLKPTLERRLYGREAYHIQCRKSLLDKVKNDLETVGIQNPSTKTTGNDGFHVLKVTFVADGIPMEIQVLTEQQDIEARAGDHAHDAYKEGRLGFDAAVDVRRRVHERRQHIGDLNLPPRSRKRAEWLDIITNGYVAVAAGRTASRLTVRR